MPRKLKTPAVEQASYPSEQVDPLRLIALLPLRPYHVVADLRAASGHFTIPIAKHLFSGKVYALVSNAETRKALEEKLVKDRLNNVIVLSPAQQGEVPKEGLDGVLIPFALYGVANKKAFLRKAVSLLKKGAWAAVLEWYKKEMPNGPLLEQRVDEGTVTELAKEAGFRFSERRDLGDQHYMVVLRK